MTLKIYEFSRCQSAKKKNHSVTINAMTIQVQQQPFRSKNISKEKKFQLKYGNDRSICCLRGTLT